MNSSLDARTVTSRATAVYLTRRGQQKREEAERLG